MSCCLAESRPHFLSGSLVLVSLLLLACGGAAPEGDATTAERAPAADAGSAAAVSGDFEGVIHFRTMDEGDVSDGVLQVKGSRWRFDMAADGDSGHIVHGSDGRMFSVSHTERQYMYFPQVEGGTDALQFAELGGTDRVAGYDCRWYRISDPSGVQDGDEVCVTTSLGFVGFGPSGASARLDQESVRQQFRAGFMILKSRDPQGGVEYEVTRVERTSVADDRFQPPSGYTEFTVPGMGSRR